MFANRPNQHGLWLGVKLMPAKGLNQHGLELGEKLMPAHRPNNMDWSVATACQETWREAKANRVSWWV